MAEHKIILIDKIKWWISNPEDDNRNPDPLCPKHDLRMKPTPRKVYNSSGRSYFSTEQARELTCAEGPHNMAIPRDFSDERQYVIDRIDAMVFKNMKLLNLDDEAVPIAESKAHSRDDKYFVTSRLMQSKRGLQLVVYAGEKGKPEKTQIFVEPEVRRLDFDRNNLHPNEVFLAVEAIFDDGSSHSIKKRKR